METHINATHAEHAGTIVPRHRDFQERGGKSQCSQTPSLLSSSFHDHLKPAPSSLLLKTSGEWIDRSTHAQQLRPLWGWRCAIISRESLSLSVTATSWQKLLFLIHLFLRSVSKISGTLSGLHVQTLKIILDRGPISNLFLHLHLNFNCVMLNSKWWNWKFKCQIYFQFFLKLDEPHRLSYPPPEQVTCHACVGVVSHVCVTYWVVCLVHGEVFWGAGPSLASCWSRCGRWWHTAVFELSLSVIQHPHRHRLVSSLLLSVEWYDALSAIAQCLCPCWLCSLPQWPRAPHTRKE